MLYGAQDALYVSLIRGAARRFVLESASTSAKTQDDVLFATKQYKSVPNQFACYCLNPSVKLYPLSFTVLCYSVISSVFLSCVSYATHVHRSAGDV